MSNVLTNSLKSPWPPDPFIGCRSARVSEVDSLVNLQLLKTVSTTYLIDHIYIFEPPCRVTAMTRSRAMA